MATFTFKAKKPSGEVYSEKKEAADRFELYRLIKESGDELISVDEKGKHGKLNMNMSISLFKRVKSIEKINFARNLGSMIEAGLALSRALSVLERQTHNAYFKSIILGVHTNIDKGMTFADALAKYPKVFPSLFVSMVHAGEQSGTLASSLKVVGLQMESSFALERRVKGALMYPAVIVCAMILVGVIMFIFVVPTLLSTFTSLNVPLPWATQMILDFSNLLQHDGLYVLIGLIVLVVAFFRFIKTDIGKRINHALILKIPGIGGLVQEVNAARTARTLSSLLGSGVDVVEAVSITAQVVQNVYFRRVLEKAGEAIKKGDLMSVVFAKYPKQYPSFLSEMMSVGEETGKIGEMLAGVAKYYEEDVDQKTKDISTIIEPLIMIVIAAGVGFFAVAMISPMYSLVNAF